MILDPKQISRMIRRVLLVAALPFPFLVYALAARFYGLVDQVGLHYAQLCRNIVSGQGWTTSVLTPRGIVDVPQLESHPDLWAAPLYAVWQSIIFLLLRPGERVAAVASAIIWLALMWSTFAIAAKRYQLKTAWLVFILLLFNPYLLDMSISGTPLGLAALLLLWFLHLLIPHANESIPARVDQSPWRRLIITAVLAGLITLTWYDLAFPVLLALLVYWGHWPERMGLNQPLEVPRKRVKQGERKSELLTMSLNPFPRARDLHPILWIQQRLAPKLMLAALGVVAGVTLIWQIRNLWWTGNPFYSLYHFELLTQTRSFPGQSVFRTAGEAAPTINAFLFSNPLEVPIKYGRGMAAAFLALLQPFNLVLLMFLALGFLRTELNKPQALWIRYWSMVAFFYLSALALHSGDPRGIVLLIPTLVMTGVGELMRWHESQLSSRDRGRSRQPIQGALGLLQAKPVLFAGLIMALLAIVQLAGRPAREGEGIRLGLSANVDWLAQRVAPEQAVLVASPWLLAWHGEVNSVWMPQADHSLRFMLDQYGASLPYLYFPRQRPLPPAADPVPNLWFEWRRSTSPIYGYRPISSQVLGETLHERMVN